MPFTLFKAAIMGLATLMAFAHTSSDPYSFKVADINGRDSIDLNDFRGKKILLVNTAISSEYSGQFRSLDSLDRKFGDSLIVIVFPSNSFGNESEKNRDIKRILKRRYGAHFLMAEKTIVSGSNASPLFKWLANRSRNNSMNAIARTDFCKFLIGKDGRLVGVFAASVDPLDSLIQRAITH